jgi:hypothetical protein
MVGKTMRRHKHIDTAGASKAGILESPGEENASNGDYAITITNYDHEGDRET